MALLSCHPRVTVASCFVYSYHGLIIDRSLVYLSYPQDRINTQVIYRLELAQVECTSKFLLNNCKQNITPRSLLVGTTVVYVLYSVILCCDDLENMTDLPLNF